MAQFTVRQKYATIRAAVVEAADIEEALSIARKGNEKLFPKDAEEYVETEFDAWDENHNLYQSTNRGAVRIHTNTDLPVVPLAKNSQTPIGWSGDGAAASNQIPINKPRLPRPRLRS